MTVRLRIVDNRLGQIADGMEAAADVVVRKTAFDLEARIKANIQAQGLVDTGNYLNSWQTEHGAPGQATVYSAVVYGPRLNYGFHGVDALGRNYAQAARPHVEPAVDAVYPSFVAAMAQLERLL